MQKLIQKVKQTTFEELCPQWNMHLAKMKSLRGISTNDKKFTFLGNDQEEYNLMDRRCCIVGEAWKGKDSYDGCNECTRFSSSGFIDFNTFRQFNKVKNEFVSHWNQTHL